MAATIEKLIREIETVIKIDKGLPVPKVASGPTPKYPWRSMEVGDSFLFPTTTRHETADRCARAQSRDGRKFIVKKTPDGTRAWRTA